jgi:hypothetical protein
MRREFCCIFCCLQVHNHRPSLRAEALSGARLHLVFQLPTSLLEVQNKFQDRVQNSGKICIEKFIGTTEIY